MKVHVITRVNLKYDPKFEFTKERLELLLWSVAPAMKKQTYKDVVWVGLVDEETSVEMLWLLWEVFDEMYTSYKNYIMDNKWEETLTIRLDSDDIPNEDYIQEIVNAVDTTKEIQCIVANKWVDWNTKTDEMITIQVDYPIGFFGIYEKELNNWCYYFKNHSKLDLDNVYLSDFTDKKLWIRLIHGKNRGSKVLLSKYKI